MFFFFRVNVHLHVNIAALVILHQASRCSCLDISSRIAIKALIISRQDVLVSTYFFSYCYRSLNHPTSRCSCLNASFRVVITTLFILRQGVLVLTNHSKCYIICANVLMWLYTSYVNIFIHF